MTFVKICGLSRWEDVEVAVEAGADAVGFVFEPSSPRYVGDHLEEVLRWVEQLPEEVHAVAVAGHSSSLPVGATALFSYTQWVKGPVPEGARGTIRAVSADADPNTLPECDLLLVDSVSAKDWGGTGRVADWAAASRLVSSVARPVLLAGGLHPGNVAEAIRTVQPYGVDVSSGVECEPGKKDAARIRAFVAAAKGSL